MQEAPPIGSEQARREVRLPDNDIAATGAGSLQGLLQQYWGYTSFRPLQREAIDAVIERRDSLVVLPTGGGKSLCFQLPALVDAPGAGAATSGRRSPVALVISPLIALMKDQVDGLLAQGVSAASLHSGQTPAERRAALDLLQSGACRLLYVAPERAVGETADGLRALLAARGVAYVAVDEAHCISQWGHDFRPEYRLLASLREAFAGIALHAYTATATPRVRRDICDQLRLVDPAVLVGAFDRPNLTYRVLPRAHFRRQLLTILRRHAGEAGIVYCLSRRDVDELAVALADQGVRALPYHAGLDDATRHRHQDAFLNESIDVMVATVAFGMGIDRSDVRFVVHDGAPPSLEQYQQEAGRAGRDGLPAECALVTSPADFARWRERLDSKGQWTEEARTLLRGMQRYAAATSCRHRALVGYFGQDLPGDTCGACDWCLGELERADEPVVLAQKILSAVARTGQRWGVGHIVSVLRGEAIDAVTRSGHDTLSVFGLLGDMPAAELRGYVDQLTQAGFLVRAGDQYPTLAMSDSGVALMRGQTGCVLFRQPLPAKGKARKPARHGEESWAGVDATLFERLRALRLELARDRGVPPYVIFHDTTLRELARARPRRLADLHDIPGVGEKKVEAFGAAVLDVILGDAHPGV
jgi:ATP-dependent DNA helicase RecQ